MEEGELLKVKAVEAIRKEELKEKARRDKETESKKQANVISLQNQQLKLQELEKEKQEDRKIEEHRKKMEAAQ